MNSHRYSLIAGAVAAALLTTRIVAADALLATDAAADTATTDENALSEVIVTGTRVSGVKAIDSAAPVQVVDQTILAKTSSTPDLIQTLAAIVPSLQTTQFSGDLSNLTLQAALRGLSPNDTLILINGKRRHTTSNIDVGGSGEFVGGAGADLNYIPADAIDHIEVLTDGAAAQYGSDAIAGVINIILKKGYEGGNLQASYGGYQDGGGKTDDVTGNIGFEPYEGAYLNFTGELRNHGHTVRSEALDYTLPAAFDSSGTPIAGLYPAAGLKPIDYNVLNATGWPIVNPISGDAAYDLKIGSFNSGFKIGEDVEFYSFGTYGQKSANSYENYRLPHIAAYTPAATESDPDPTTTYQYPYGFEPEEAIDETDYGLTGGLRGALVGWNWDLSSTYGRDYNDFYTLDSTNSVEYSRTGYAPTDFYDGSFKATQWTNNLDLDHEFEVGLAGPLNVALGAEERRDAYVITAGSPLSYQLGGAASFAGFSPTDASAHSRTNTAGYLDVAAKVIGALRLDVAGRYEHYSDFGDARSGKLTARYDFSPAIALRGTVSNGFRAPTVAEEYYTKTSTSPTSTGVQLGSDAPAAQLFGLGSLQPETSVNYSLGVVFTPTTDFTGTLDLYQINLDHRIVSTESFYALLNGIAQPSTALVTNALNTNGNQLNPAITTTSVNFFTNGVDTSTQGADLALDYVTEFERFGKVDWSVNANYNHTTITGVRNTPPELTSVGLTILNPQGFSGLTNSQPKYDVILGSLWTYQRLTINLREVIHDTTTTVESDDGATTPGKITYFTAYSGVIPITNLDIGYDVLKSVKLSVGAVDLFNRYPDKLPAGLLAAYQKGGYSFAATQYTAGPLGINGGYYYVKATYTF
jgi:iron complex outermembrane recepter protein